MGRSELTDKPIEVRLFLLEGEEGWVRREELLGNGFGQGFSVGSPLTEAAIGE